MLEEELEKLLAKKGALCKKKMNILHALEYFKFSSEILDF